MTKGRDIAAESINDLLTVARAQRRSGLLSAEYSHGGRLEEGEIYVLAGQPIYARVGNLVGQEALQYLLRWRNIHFSFVTDVPQPPANIYSTSQLERGTGPLQPRAFPPAPFAATGGPRWSTPPEQPSVAPPSRARIPGIEWRVPQKVEPEPENIFMQLTRRQRLIYFLVDGSRTVADLARTSNKTVLEVELVLSELQEMGLVIL
jgi:hypothetical protein